MMPSAPGCRGNKTHLRQVHAHVQDAHLFGRAAERDDFLPHRAALGQERLRFAE